MSVLTESKLRATLRNEKIKEYTIKKQDIVTPAARAYLRDKGIKLVTEDDKKAEKKSEEKEVNNQSNKGMIPKYENILGGYFEDKPEFMTQLYGNKLVYKDHPKIELRGKLDSMQAKILEVQIIAEKNKKAALVKDLEEILGVIRNIMAAEILNKELENVKILGMTEAEVRAISHNPKKYLGVEHVFYATYDMGECYIALNSLRTYIREVEISALKAFKNNDGDIARTDIMRCLNRLSSYFYVMMLKLKAGYYK